MVFDADDYIISYQGDWAGASQCRTQDWIGSFKISELFQIYVCTYVRTYVRTYVYVCLCMSMYVYVCLCMSMYVYVCLCLCMSMYVYVCLCKSMYVYVCLCMSTYVCMSMYVHVCPCMYVRPCMSMYVCPCMSVHVCLSMYVCPCMPVHVCMYVCMLCMYVCTYVCMYVCMPMLVSIYLSMYAYVCLGMPTYVYVFVCLWMSMYVYVYIYIYTYTCRLYFEVHGIDHLVDFRCSAKLSYLFFKMLRWDRLEEPVKYVYGEEPESMIELWQARCCKPPQDSDTNRVYHWQFSGGQKHQNNHPWMSYWKAHTDKIWATET